MTLLWATGAISDKEFNGFLTAIGIGIFVLCFLGGVFKALQLIGWIKKDGE